MKRFGIITRRLVIIVIGVLGLLEEWKSVREETGSLLITGVAIRDEAIRCYQTYILTSR